MALTSSALITERIDGLLDRSWVAGKFSLLQVLIMLYGKSLYSYNTAKTFQYKIERFHSDSPDYFMNPQFLD